MNVGEGTAQTDLDNIDRHNDSFNYMCAELGYLRSDNRIQIGKLEAEQARSNDLESQLEFEKSRGDIHWRMAKKLSEEKANIRTERDDAQAELVRVTEERDEAFANKDYWKTECLEANKKFDRSYYGLLSTQDSRNHILDRNAELELSNRTTVIAAVVGWIMFFGSLLWGSA